VTGSVSNLYVLWMKSWIKATMVSAIKFAFTAETGFAIQHEMLVDVAIGSN
jgi:hypothetical protein